jgi:hypothetical protein
MEEELQNKSLIDVFLEKLHAIAPDQPSLLTFDDDLHNNDTTTSTRNTNYDF